MTRALPRAPRGRLRPAFSAFTGAAVVALAAVSAAWGCAPRASSTPLGRGPLALAELSSAPEASDDAAPPAATESPGSTASASTEAEAVDADAEATDAEDASEAPEPGDSPPSSSPTFAGLYAGKDVAVYRIEGSPEQRQLDPKAQIRIEVDSPAALRITLINSDDGSDLCELTAGVQGQAALLDAGQPCFSSDDEGGIQAELHSGKAVLDGDRLRMEAEGTLSVRVGEEELGGELSYSFEGRRQ